MDESHRSIEADVKARFAAVARDPNSEKRFPVGPESAKRLGYSAAEIDALPQSAVASFAGVGDPIDVEPLQSGDVVFDLGCGSGLDALVAAKRVGPRGFVIGIDMTPEMVARARDAARQAHAANVHVVRGRADGLPLPDASVDVVITNGVFNLCVDKAAVAAEMARVLRPGGRLRMADILLEAHVTPEQAAAKGAWSD